MNIRWLCIISGGLLMSGILDLPYLYYMFLRSAIMITSLVIAYSLYKSKSKFWALTFGAVAILFNPIIPIYLDKQNWTLIDFVVAVLFFSSSYFVGKDKKFKIVRRNKILYSFVVLGYVLGLVLSSSYVYGLLGGFIGGWVSVFFTTYVLKE